MPVLFSARRSEYPSEEKKKIRSGIIPVLFHLRVRGTVGAALCRGRWQSWFRCWGNSADRYFESVRWTGENPAALCAESGALLRWYSRSSIAVASNGAYWYSWMRTCGSRILRLVYPSDRSGCCVRRFVPVCRSSSFRRQCHVGRWILSAGKMRVLPFFRRAIGGGLRAWVRSRMFLRSVRYISLWMWHPKEWRVRLLHRFQRAIHRRYPARYEGWEYFPVSHAMTR